VREAHEHESLAGRLALNRPVFALLPDQLRGTVLGQVRIQDEASLASATQPGVPRPPDEVGWAWRRVVRAGGGARRPVSSRNGVSVSSIPPSGYPGRSGYDRNGRPVAGLGRATVLRRRLPLGGLAERSAALQL
jgi:hypothetical protein